MVQSPPNEVNEAPKKTQLLSHQTKDTRATSTPFYQAAANNFALPIKQESVEVTVNTDEVVETERLLSKTTIVRLSKETVNTQKKQWKVDMSGETGINLKIKPRVSYLPLIIQDEKGSKTSGFLAGQRS